MFEDLSRNSVFFRTEVKPHLPLLSPQVSTWKGPVSKTLLAYWQLTSEVRRHLSDVLSGLVLDAVQTGAACVSLKEAVEATLITP